MFTCTSKISPDCEISYEANTPGSIVGGDVLDKDGIKDASILITTASYACVTCTKLLLAPPPVVCGDELTSPISSEIVGESPVIGDDSVVPYTEMGSSKTKDLYSNEGVQIEEISSVNHPVHYNKGKYETIDVIEDWKLGFHVGNAVKYLSRAEHKGNLIEDLKKANWYITRVIDLEEKN